MRRRGLLPKAASSSLEGFAMRATARPARLAASRLLAAALVAGCAASRSFPTRPTRRPLVLVPAGSAGVVDKRARFREIYCAVLEAHGHELPDYRSCDDALHRVGAEPAGSARAVDLAPSRRKLVAAIVPGIGYDCFAKWLAPAGTTAAHLRRFGYDLVGIKVDALSGTAKNASQIRDAVMAMDTGDAPRLVLIGYRRALPTCSTRSCAIPRSGRASPRSSAPRARSRLGARQRRRAVPGRAAAALPGRGVRRRRRAAPSRACARRRGARGSRRTRCRPECACIRS
jgi:hypothetical protein